MRNWEQNLQFAVLKQWLLQQRETEASFGHVIIEMVADDMCICKLTFTVIFDYYE